MTISNKAIEIRKNMEMNCEKIDEIFANETEELRYKLKETMVVTEINTEYPQGITKKELMFIRSVFDKRTD